MSYQVVNREQVEISPLNPPSDNLYSFRNGNPVVSFVIPNQNKLLKASSIRLNGEIILRNGAGVAVDNNNSKGTAGSQVTMNPRVSVHGAIQQVTIMNQENNQTLETIRNYNRYLASVVPVTQSQNDFDSHLSFGLQGSNHRVHGNFFNNPTGFCIPLLTGLLNSNTPIPLGNNGVRGLIIQLELTPDNMLLHNFDRGSNTDATANGGAFYQLRDLTLTYELLNVDSSSQSQMGIPSSGAFSYNSVGNIYSVINASDHTQTYNLGTSNTLSIIHNFVPTTQINNYLFDSLRTPALKNIVNNNYGVDVAVNEVIHARGGRNFPIDYEIDETVPNTSSTPISNLDMNLVNAIKPIPKYNHSLKSLFTETNKGSKFNYQTRTEYPLASESGLFQNDLDAGGNVVANNKVYGIGVSFDNVSKVGVSFKDTPYSLRIKSALNGNSPNSIYTYTFNKNTLLYSPSGVMVQN